MPRHRFTVEPRAVNAQRVAEFDAHRLFAPAASGLVDASVDAREQTSAMRNPLAGETSAVYRAHAPRSPGENHIALAASAF